MLLTNVQITEFKSVRDSGEFEVGDVTCLVGKNEAGKTSLLQALYRLNPTVDADAKFDVTQNYPRADVEDYEQAIAAKIIEPAIVVKARYELTDEDIRDAEKDFGDGLFLSRVANLERGYSNETSFSILTDEAVAVQHLIRTLPQEMQDEAKNLGDLSSLKRYLQAEAGKADKAHKDALAAANAIPDAAEKAKATLQAAALQEPASAKTLRTELGTYLAESFDKFIWDKYLDAKVPTFLYFDEYYQMEGQLNIDQLKVRQTQGKLRDSDRPMLGLIDLARLNLDDLINAKDTQALLNKLEGASNHLSKQILKYWSQNKHIHVRFDLRNGLPEDPEGMREGKNLWGFVYDTKHLAATGLGTRSRGFVWFFSFLAWFSQQKKLNKPMILLLDEPGLFLHASAQADLLRYIENELKPYHQVIYSTHSPFMVDASKFRRVRIVRDRSMESDDELPEDQRGTRVSTDVLEADSGSLFPLQGALGYDIAQTLFVGPNSLIVEGVSDLIYLQAISGYLQSLTRVPLSSAWTITPVGGSDKVPTFVALLGSQKGLNLATLIDFQSKDAQTIENLYKKKLLAKKNVLTFSDFTGTTEADIEDMFEPQFYTDLVNAEYANELPKPITLADLPKHPRILVRIEGWLSANPLKKGSLNHYRPARYFAENLATLAARLDEPTILRFENAFTALNGLIQ